MPDIPELFKGMKITNYYKYILYLSGIVLIISLFFDTKEISNAYVRHIAFWTIIASLALWFLDTIISNVNTNLYEDYVVRKNNKEYYFKIVKWLGRINYSIHIIAWALVLLFVFDFSFI